MTPSKTGAERRLERLERVLSGRRKRLATALAGQQRRAAYTGPIGRLQRYGYAVALLLALSAVLPTVIGFGWRRRNLLGRAAANGLALRKLGKRFDSVRSRGIGS